MDVEDLLRSSGLPEVSVDTDHALTSTIRRGRVRRRRRIAGVGVCVVVLVGGLTVVGLNLAGQNDEDRVATAPGADSGGRGGKWRKLAGSPLSPRHEGIAAWTGTEVIVAGGTDTKGCPPDADCLVELRPLSDGAAYDPDSDTWRSIPDSPVPFLSGPSTWTGTEILVIAQRQGTSDVLLSYDPESDSWARRADPPVDGLLSMAWNGDSWVGISPHGDRPALRYSPEGDSWDTLDPAPLGEVSLAVVWTGTELVLLGSGDDQPGEPANGFWEAAALNSEGAWRRFRASEIYNNGGRWSVIDGLVVNPGRGPTVGYETGGILDPTSGTWAPIPPDRPSIGGRTGFSGVADGWVVDDGLLMDPVAGRWHRIEDRPDEVTPAVAAWTGDELVTWGGRIERGPGSPKLVATGFAYRPPADVEQPSPTEPVSPSGTSASCVQGYSPEALRDRSFAFDGEVTKVQSNDDPRVPEHDPAKIVAQFEVREWFVGGEARSVSVQMQREVSVGQRLLVTGEPRWGGEPLQDPIAWECGFTSAYSTSRAADWRQVLAPYPASNGPPFTVGLSDGTGYRVAFDPLPGASDPSISVGAALTEPGAFVTVFPREPSDPTPPPVLGSWSLPSGQTATMNDREGRLELRMTSGAFEIDISPLPSDMTVEEAKNLTKTLDIDDSAGPGGWPIVSPLRRTGVRPPVASFDFGEAWPHMSLNVSDCSGTEITDAGSESLAAYSRCLPELGLRAHAQGPDPENTRALLESLVVERTD